ncbi:MAG: hypothetical protein NTX54_04785 [Chloroflexi bacterium]|nr:hypothetical protein [Chloroflexota bacterium]
MMLTRVPKWAIYAGAGVAMLTIGPTVFNLALRLSLGLITMAIVLVTGLAFLGVAGFFAYLVWRFVVDKLHGW